MLNWQCKNHLVSTYLHSSSQILEQKILEYIKLVELVVQFIGLVAFSREGMVFFYTRIYEN
jgi:hypothetical protein